MVDNRTFGGQLYDYDFNMRYQSLSVAASRVASDMRFDERCKKAVEQQDNQESKSCLRIKNVTENNIE